MSKGVYRFKLGDVDGAVLRDGAREMALEESFPSVPAGDLARAAQELGLSSDTRVGYNCLYLATSEHRVLVDTGGGSGELLANLAAMGVSPDSIDTVILTHGDGDHIGGIGSFPSARFVMSAEAYRLWTTPEGRQGLVDEFLDLFRDGLSEDDLQTRAKGRAAFGADLLPSLGERLVALETGDEVIPGLRLLPAPGHRSDHTALELRSQGETLLHVADAFRHPLQVAHPEWTSFIDSHPEQAAATARALLTQAAEEDALVFAAHLPLPALGRVTRTDDGLRWRSVEG